MIEIKCSAAEKKRLMDILDMEEQPCPFTRLCSELPYYRTGMNHKECIENNIKWVIVGSEPETKEKKCASLDREITVTAAKFLEIASNAAVEYYEPHKNGTMTEFLMSTGFVTILMKKLFKEDK